MKNIDFAQPLPERHRLLKIFMKLSVAILCFVIVFAALGLAKIDELLEIMEHLEAMKQDRSFQRFMNLDVDRGLNGRKAGHDPVVLEELTEMVDETLVGKVEKGEAEGQEDPVDRPETQAESPTGEKPDTALLRNY